MRTCPAVAVCAGSDCAKDQRKRFRRLLDALGDLDVLKTRCLDVCKGPVAVLEPAAEKPVVVQSVKRKHLEELRWHVVEGTRPGERTELDLTKGKKRAKARKKVRKALDAV
jgi:hypothetical protein